MDNSLAQVICDAYEQFKTDWKCRISKLIAPIPMKMSLNPTPPLCQ